MLRYIAPLSVIVLSCALPHTASAATSTRALCREAQANPSAFLSRSDFAESVLRMSERCPDIALALTNTITGTITGATDLRDGKSIKAGKSDHDYSDLLERLKVATKTLDTATSNVSKAQANLERTIRRASLSGMSEEDLQAHYALNGPDGDRLILPDVTAAKRRALENYVAARDRLATAEEKLDQANENARPLVEKALELAGKSNVAQENLSGALQGLTATERKALLDKTLSDATQSVADLEARIASETTSFEQASRALQNALNSRHYKEALDEVQDEERDYAKEYAKYQDRLARDPSCRSGDCRSAKKKAEDAAEDLQDAKKDLAKVEKYLNIEGLNSAYTAKAAALAASKAQEALAKDAADSAAAQARELAKLLDDASEALTKANAASEEARAATASEEAEVTAARAALETALAEAEAALEGSAEAEAAMEAVYDAKADLRAALEQLGAAQEIAGDLMEEVAAIKTPPAEVEQSAEALDTASEAGQTAQQEAEEAYLQGTAAIVDHDVAHYYLREELEKATDHEKRTQDQPAEDEQAQEDTDEKSSEPSEPSEPTEPSEPSV